MSATVTSKKSRRKRYTACGDVAERKGFEPLKEFKSLHDFQSCALDQLSHLSKPIQLWTVSVSVSSIADMCRPVKGAGPFFFRKIFLTVKILTEMRKAPSNPLAPGWKTSYNDLCRTH